MDEWQSEVKGERGTRRYPSNSAKAEYEVPLTEREIGTAILFPVRLHYATGSASAASDFSSLLKLLTGAL